ncbi:MAG: hypothetical protein AAGD25_05925 [Cyanobacteria bacterium P01_F01_bin.150]
MRKTDLTDFNWFVSLISWFLTVAAIAFVASAYGNELNHPNVPYWFTTIKIGLIVALSTTSLGLILSIQSKRNCLSIQRVQMSLGYVYSGLGIFALVLMVKIFEA